MRNTELISYRILSNGLEQGKNGKNGMQWQSSLLRPPLLQSLPDPDAAAESWPDAASPECVQSRWEGAE